MVCSVQSKFTNIMALTYKITIPMVDKHGVLGGCTPCRSTITHMILQDKKHIHLLLGDFSFVGFVNMAHTPLNFVHWCAWFRYPADWKKNMGAVCFWFPFLCVWFLPSTCVRQSQYYKCYKWSSLWTQVVPNAIDCEWSRMPLLYESSWPGMPYCHH